MQTIEVLVMIHSWSGNANNPVGGYPGGGVLERALLEALAFIPPPLGGRACRFGAGFYVREDQFPITIQGRNDSRPRRLD
jgi:hypothetical protein